MLLPFGRLNVVLLLVLLRSERSNELLLRLGVNVLEGFLVVVTRSLLLLSNAPLLRVTVERVLLRRYVSLSGRLLDIVPSLRVLVENLSCLIFSELSSNRILFEMSTLLLRSKRPAPP